MELTFEGVVTSISPIKDGVGKNGKPFCNMNFVVTETGDNEWKQSMSFNIFGKPLIEKLDIKKDVYVVVHFNSRAVEYKGKYFNNINAWKVEKDTTSYNPSSAANYAKERVDAPVVEQVHESRTVTKPVSNTVEEDDDLPF